MSQRFFLYPLIFVAVMQLLPFLGRDRGYWRWHSAQILQLALVLITAALGMVLDDQICWVILAWGIFIGLVMLPRILAGIAMRAQMTFSLPAAARFWKASAWLSWGELARLYRAHASMLELWANNERGAADVLFGLMISPPAPSEITGMVRIWRLMLLVASRDFPAAVQFYDSVHDWGSLDAATQARLYVARAFAETGQFARALRSLQFVALSPRTIGARERQLWMARIIVTALAGDPAGMEKLLSEHSAAASRRGGFARFVAYWRGRCALIRSERAEAGRQLSRALALTPAKQTLLRETTREFLQRVESLSPSEDTGANGLPASLPEYVAGQHALELAEQQASGWRALMFIGRPELITLGLLVLITTVFLIDQIVFTGWLQIPLCDLLGNIPTAVHEGEWWRLVTALALHANTLHLAMNGLALWMFGTAVEKSLGWWRYLVIFLVAGTFGNWLSSHAATYDVSVGASGAIFGIVAAFAVVAYRVDAPMYAAVRRRLLMLLSVMVTCDFTISWLEPQIDNLAHTGGFVAGLVLALVLYPRRQKTGRSLARRGGVE